MPFQNSYIGASTRELEEKIRVLRDRVILFGKNLVETKKELREEIIELRKDLETMKEDIKKLVRFLETASAEFSKFARKEEVETLIKQAKMFQPLEFVRRDELKELLKK